MVIYGGDEKFESLDGAAMSTPKLTALLGAVRPDGTITMHVSASGMRPVPREPKSLREAAELLSEATSALIADAFGSARTADEIDDMTVLSVYSNNWIQGICLGLGIDIFEGETP